MESQIHGPAGQTYDQVPQQAVHSVVEDEGDYHQHDKKSVLKKVKDKAKKIKDTIKKHGYGHDEHEHERDYTHGDHDEDEEDGEDEEMVEDPEAHGAPMYESTAVRSVVPDQKVNLEKPTALGEDRYDAQNIDKHGPAKPVLEGHSEQSSGGPSAMEVVHAPEDKDISFPPEVGGIKGASGDRKAEEDFAQKELRTSVPQGLEEDRDAPRNQHGVIPSSNYETKVTDPTGKGGEEAGITPLLQSFDKMSVNEESGAKSGAEPGEEVYTGSHDQFAPEKNPTEGEGNPKTSTPKSYDPNNPEDLPREAPIVKSRDQSGYIEKLSAATSTIADKAISAKNAVASKLGYGGTEGTKAPVTEESKDAVKSAAPPTEYAHKVAATVTEKLAPVYGKVADAGGSVISKVKGNTGTGNEGTEASGGKVPDKGVSVKEYLAEKLKPGEEDKALSEVISDTLHKKKEEAAKSGESKPMGKVTESEAVARHLGTGMEGARGGEDAIAAGKESSGNSVVDRLKGAVSSWISKGGEEQGPQNSSFVSDGSANVAGELGHSARTEERRLQESGN